MFMMVFLFGIRCLVGIVALTRLFSEGVTFSAFNLCSGTAWVTFRTRLALHFG